MVSKPAHSGCESWLQSVWAVGRYLSQYSSAVDAFAAPGTCKQLAPQITVFCGGARETTMLYLNTHATCGWAGLNTQFKGKSKTRDKELWSSTLLTDSHVAESFWNKFLSKWKQKHSKHKKTWKRSQKKGAKKTQRWNIHKWSLQNKPHCVFFGHLTPLTSSINIRTFITTSKKTFRAPGFAWRVLHHPLDTTLPLTQII